MRFFTLLLIAVLLISCYNKRQGIPENKRNYLKDAATVPLGKCFHEDFAFMEFAHLNADTVTKAIAAANRKYFGAAFDTPEIRDSIHTWLKDNYFSKKTYEEKEWILFDKVDTTRFTTGYHSVYGLNSLGIDLMYRNDICYTEYLGSKGVYEYRRKSGGNWYSQDKTLVKVVCDFNIDLTYTPHWFIFSSSQREYYRITLRDTASVYSTFDDNYYRENLSAGAHSSP
ncbi:hypothetical protein [Chitinophaga rhizophila]|uniref:Lipoprotein n=1 Tax=Chitinophaga rhizophila TaxID=2866212 RepID=A0ABS7GIA5_9BACT|nr:hypothetical protein [Chitinophaga rhizophila]MBW8687156.1 hypothetical protein [Chitinophaga rhizophila]